MLDGLDENLVLSCQFSVFHKFTLKKEKLIKKKVAFVNIMLRYDLEYF